MSAERTFSRRMAVGVEINGRIGPGFGLGQNAFRKWGVGIQLNWRTGYGDGMEWYLRFDLRINEFREGV